MENNNYGLNNVPDVRNKALFQGNVATIRYEGQHKKSDDEDVVIITRRETRENQEVYYIAFGKNYVSTGPGASICDLLTFNEISVQFLELPIDNLPRYDRHYLGPLVAEDANSIHNLAVAEFFHRCYSQIKEAIAGDLTKNLERPSHKRPPPTSPSPEQG